MGAVYAAVHSVIDKRAAIKVLRRDLCTKPEFVQRFLTEARAVNRIGHPNIIDVFGFGTTVDGRVFLAMELLEGQSLGKRMAAGPLDADSVCDIGIEIMEKEAGIDLDGQFPVVVGQLLQGVGHEEVVGVHPGGVVALHLQQHAVDGGALAH